MFNLEQSIANWRQQMLAAGVKTPVPLEELENHLREDIEQHVQAGLDAGTAFKQAAKRLGEAGALTAEFERVENPERKSMKRALIIIAGIVGVLVGMAFVTPAVAQYNHEGVMRNGEPWLFLLGSLLTLAGCGAAVRGFRKSRT